MNGLLILTGAGVVISIVIFLIYFLGIFSIIPILFILFSGIAGWHFEGERMKQRDRENNK